MADAARVFVAGDAQAVLLPDKFRLDVDEVESSREGQSLILRPKLRQDWSRLIEALDSVDAARFADCFPAGREQPLEQERPALASLLNSGDTLRN